MSLHQTKLMFHNNTLLSEGCELQVSSVSPEMVKDIFRHTPAIKTNEGYFAINLAAHGKLFVSRFNDLSPVIIDADTFVSVVRMCNQFTHVTIMEPLTT